MCPVVFSFFGQTLSHSLLSTSKMLSTRKHRQTARISMPEDSAKFGGLADCEG